jgi:hypothetical protein
MGRILQHSAALRSGDARVLLRWDSWVWASGTLVADLCQLRVRFYFRGRSDHSRVDLGDLPEWFFSSLSPMEVSYLVMGLLKKASDSSLARADGYAAQDNDLASRCPLLHAYLCDLAFDTGEPRRTASLLLFTEGGSFRGCLTDRAVDRNCWAEGATVEALLDHLESRLSDPSLVWRVPSRRAQRK